MLNFRQGAATPRHLVVSCPGFVAGASSAVQFGDHPKVEQHWNPPLSPFFPLDPRRYLAAARRGRPWWFRARGCG